MRGIATTALALFASAVLLVAETAAAQKRFITLTPEGEQEVIRMLTTGSPDEWNQGRVLASRVPVEERSPALREALREALRRTIHETALGSPPWGEAKSNLTASVAANADPADIPVLALTTLGGPAAKTLYNWGHQATPHLIEAAMSPDVLGGVALRVLASIVTTHGTGGHGDALAEAAALHLDRLPPHYRYVSRGAMRSAITLAGVLRTPELLKRLQEIAASTPQELAELTGLEELYVRDAPRCARVFFEGVSRLQELPRPERRRCKDPAAWTDPDMFLDKVTNSPAAGAGTTGGGPRRTETGCARVAPRKTRRFPNCSWGPPGLPFRRNHCDDPRKNGYDMKHQSTPKRCPVQLCMDLPVPEALHAAGLQDGSRWPYVFRRLADGGGVTEREPALEAWSGGPCVQHHSDTSWTGVYLDLDSGDAGSRVLEAADGDRVAAPNVLVVRRSSGHAAVAWFLQEPVHKYPERGTPPSCSTGGRSSTTATTGDTDRFWYRNNTGSGFEFILVNPAATGRDPLFDHYRLASAMSLANDTSYVPEKLPFSTFRFGGTESEIEFAAGSRRFLCDIAEYACTVADTLPSRTAFAESPDGRWEAFAHEYNLYVRPAEGGDSIPLTTDGEKYYAYGYSEPRPNQQRQGPGPRAPTLSWSPDSRYIAVSRQDERDVEHMHYISYTPQRPRHFSQPYALPGDSVIPLPSVHILAVEETAPPDGSAPGLRATANHRVEIAPTPHQLSFRGSAPDSAWSADGTRLHVNYFTRGSQRVFLAQIDAATGASRVILGDSTQTFVSLGHRGGGSSGGTPSRRRLSSSCAAPTTAASCWSWNRPTSPRSQRSASPRQRCSRRRRATASPISTACSICPPRLDENAKYPIISHIYPGPQVGSVGAWAFKGGGEDFALAQLGFVVVQIDHLGTPHRSKAFHDNYYGNFIDNGIPDHIAVIKQLAARYPFIDLDRVGIYGHSGGGFASTDAILRFPEFFKVAVSGAGNHDNRTYNIYWAEKYQGVMQSDSGGGDNFESAANKTYAANLEGKLLLVHGDMDDNVHPAMTVQLVDELIKANRDFDFIWAPNRAHGLNEPYFIRRRWDYFVRHLLGAEPPSQYEITRPTG